MAACSIVVTGDARDQLLGTVDKAGHRVAVSVGVTVDASRNLLSASV